MGLLSFLPSGSIFTKRGGGFDGHIFRHTKHDKNVFVTVGVKSHAVSAFKVGGKGVSGGKMLAKSVAAIFGIGLFSCENTRKAGGGIMGGSKTFLLIRCEKTRGERRYPFSVKVGQ